MITALNHNKIQSQNLTLIGFGFVLVSVVLASLSLGAFSIPLPQTFAILFDLIGIKTGTFEVQQANVLLQIRAPRVLMTLLVGGGLGIAGAALQGMFRNPLVEPGLIGVSTGSALFAVIFMVLIPAAPASLAWIKMLGLPLFAFVGGLICMVSVYQLSKSQGKTDGATLILAGVAINALAAALIGLVLFFADDSALRSFTFWSLGDTGGATWAKIPVTLTLIAVPSLLVLFNSRQLNALALGEHEAFHMGVNVQQVKSRLLICSALIVGVGVSMVGMIGFVGLVVPHLIRILFGADHRLVLPGSFLLGAILLNFADLIARVIVIPAEMPIGVITALIGAPFFIWLIFNLNKSKK
ncbi:iron complex transport system permease protein [Algoriphagus sp. 4150]|uniref:FecCD family ABC transporter permease n=1 Tax=Algoriphagus sp. 4150 TaxID=2817756 RepID=UPI0028541BDC|nr:iron ABC transporter permease [Algoriphagus sp. 4150]MDR7129920.1 iron complex transport system permease protein [Algoriphagus sp. 4150]